MEAPGGGARSKHAWMMTGVLLKVRDFQMLAQRSALNCGLGRLCQTRMVSFTCNNSRWMAWYCNPQVRLIRSEGLT